MDIQLFPSFLRLVTVWIATGILFFFFRKFFWSSIVSYVAKRESYVVDQVEAATQSNKKAIELEAQANDSLKQARVDSKLIVDRSKNEAIKLKEEIVNTAKLEANDKVESARLEIEREKQLARKEIEGEIVDIALSAAREIVKDSINEKKSAEFVDDFIKELKA